MCVYLADFHFALLGTLPTPNIQQPMTLDKCHYFKHAFIKSIQISVASVTAWWMNIK